MKPIKKVLLVDDHDVVLRGLREIVEETVDDVEVVTALNRDEAMECIGTTDLDLVLLDVMVPGEGTVIDTIEKIRALSQLPILIVTGYEGVEIVVETIRAGANGFIRKHRAGDDLADAIATVASGGTFLHPTTAVEVAGAIGSTNNEAAHEELSPRELQIFRLIAVGHAIKEIAADLHLSDKTVSTYLARIRKKTGLTSHVEIARYALQHDLVD